MPGHRIFVGRVPVTVTKDEVTARFAKFGKILDAYIPINPITRMSKGMAFISFDNAEAVEQALAQGKHLLGGELCEVKRADPKAESATALVPVPGLGLVPTAVHLISEFRVFVKGIADELPADLIRAHFEKFGIVNDVYLPVQYGCTDGIRY
jgi:RNA recognition motif-containing protein